MKNASEFTRTPKHHMQQFWGYISRLLVTTSEIWQQDSESVWHFQRWTEYQNDEKYYKNHKHLNLSSSQEVSQSLDGPTYMLKQNHNLIVD